MLFLILFSGVSLFMACGKGQNATPTDVVFYRATDCGAGTTTISINGQSAALSAVISGSAPNCGDPNAASFQLPAGTYSFTVSDNVSTRIGSVTVTANTCTEVSVACDSFSASVRNILPEYYIDSLRNWGMNIHAGLNPTASLGGIYLFSPNTLLHPFSSYDNYYIGQVIDDYKFKLYNQSGNTINVSLKDVSGNYSDTANGIAAYISGTDNSFTIFGQISGVASSIPYTEVIIISGIKTASGIQNMQEGFVMTSKTGDNFNSVLIPVGTGRTFYDEDFISGTSAFFRMPGLKSIIQTTAGSLSASGK